MSALDKVVKEAAFKCTPLPADLQLEDDGLVVDADSLLLPPPAPAAPAAPKERQPPAGLLSTRQLSMVVEILKAAAPEGFVKISDAADLLCRAASQGRAGP